MIRLSPLEYKKKKLKERKISRRKGKVSSPLPSEADSPTSSSLGPWLDNV
jgi:hypothetical protein